MLLNIIFKGCPIGSKEKCKTVPGKTCILPTPCLETGKWILLIGGGSYAPCSTPMAGSAKDTVVQSGEQPKDKASEIPLRSPLLEGVFSFPTTLIPPNEKVLQA